MEKSSIYGIFGAIVGVTTARLIFEDTGVFVSAIAGGAGAATFGGLSVLVEEAIKKLRRNSPSNSTHLKVAEQEAAVSSESEITSVETKSEKEKPYCYGFGGWLYIVTIGQLFTLYRSLTTIFETDLPLLRTPEWDMLTVPGGESYNPLWKPFVYIEIASCTIYILIIALVGYLTIKLSRYYKRAQISLYVFNIVYSAIILTFMLSLNSHYDPPVYAENEFTEIIVQTSVASVIWIPYFLLSKRVKNTFNR